MNFITGEQLKDWLAALATDRDVVAPTRVQDDLVLFQPVDSPEKVVWSQPGGPPVRTAVSPKEYFLPVSEGILTIERVKRAAAGDDSGGPKWDITLAEPELERDQVVFAIRPCDVQALLALDALMLKEPVDAYYARRRERTSLVGLACEQIGPSCFCTSVGLAPDDSRGMDVMLYTVDGGYALEVLSEKGQAIAGGLGLAPYSGEWQQKAWPEADFQVPPREVWTGLFGDPYWGRLADRCLSCKICSYVCPTCRCFDVRDYTIAQGPGYQKFERLRCWDSCMAEGYRRIAGGHNPRPTKAQRLRNRFYCKFDYYPADFGPLACVGCGRCIDHCPVNVDITEVLQAVAARG